jgi:3-deoxy-manno-octulosonate cytidylyltransferase (CMP-KDO synthetase)
MKTIAGIIPARYASSRFPGKPLILIQGKTMIQRVYEQASKCSRLSEVIVATDDERIYDHVLEFGGIAMMTSPLHSTGTERCAETAKKLADKGRAADIIINIQGDEPFINPEQISLLASCFDHQNTEIATLIKKTSVSEDLFNPNIIKVVINKQHEALYFSRSPIPFVRNTVKEQWTEHATYFKHIGIYAYRSDILQILTKLAQGMAETAESLEQLRWLENGFKILTEETQHESHSVDVPEDVLKFETKGNPG